MVIGCGVFNRKQSGWLAASSRLGGFVLFTLLVSSLFGATAAQALPYILFIETPPISDGDPDTLDFNLGFLDPFQYEAIETVYGSLSGLNQIPQRLQATDSDHQLAGSSLLLVDQVGDGVGCPFTDRDNCSDTYNVFDIVWEVTFNAAPTGDLTVPYDAHLILVDSDPSEAYVGNTVSIDYGSAMRGPSPSDLKKVDFEVARLVESPTDSYFFIDLDLGSMMHNDTIYVGFRYRVEGAELRPAGGNDAGFLYPQIIPGAYIVATPIPEPGTAMLLGLGLAALALARNRV